MTVREASQATTAEPRRAGAVSGVLAATLMLPGLAAVSHSARAEAPPERGVLAFRVGRYSDGQPGWDRITVRSPQIYLLAPIAGDWAIEATGVFDSVSGATPRMHSFRSGATPYMSDLRRAGDVHVTRYLPRGAVTLGAAYSGENDYTSRTYSANARWSSDDNNRTWALGFATSGDVIDTSQTSGSYAGQHRRTNELMVGLTQVVSMNDIARVDLTWSRGRGFYTDPYKDFDQRPDFRNAHIAVLRWNHHVERFDASLRGSYRYYRDSFGVKSHTVGVEWVQPVGAWSLTPGMRYYSQGAASFYFDPVPDAQGQADYRGTLGFASRLAGFYSADQRLAGFGAITVSLKASYAVSPEVTLDVKVQDYRQSAGLKWAGSGSPYLEPFRARFVQVGISRSF